MKPDGILAQSIDHLKRMRDLHAESIKRLAQYPDLKESVAKMREQVAKADKLIERAEKMK